MADLPAMPARQQPTPYGPLTLRSKVTHQRYYVVATGSPAALRWAFPDCQSFEERTQDRGRHVFAPYKEPVTDLQELGARLDQWAAAWASRSSGMPKTTGPARTLGEVIERFLAVQKPQVAANTMEKYKIHLGGWKELLTPDVVLDNMTYETVIQGRSRMAQKVGVVTTNDRTSTLKRVMAFAEVEGWVKELGWRRVKPLPEPQYQAAWWTADQAEIALRIAAEDRQQPTAHLFLACSLYLGLRKDELSELRWEDLLLDHTDPTGRPSPICRIRCTEEWMPKNKKPREIPISADLLAILRRHRQSSGFVLMPGRKLLREKVGTKRVYRYDTAKLWNRLRARAVAAGCSDIRQHDLRHTFASLCLNSGVSAEKVARWLGHSSTRMVFQVYGHLLAFDPQIDQVRFTTGKRA